jgi:nicotinamidase-related amidase
MYNTRLDNILKSRSIRSLVITGVVTNGCVLFTAADTMHHGYYPVVIRDCVGAYDPDWHNLALQWMETQFPVLQSDDVVAMWRGGQ